MRAERAAWLIEMGFPADASRRVAARFESTETMVEHLLASGITPSIDAATATATANNEGSGSSSTEAASAPVTLEPVALDEPILDEEVPTLEQPMSNLTLVSEADHPLANGGEGSPSGAAAEAHKMSATAVLASFVEVDAPKRSALECIPYAEHHVLLWEGRELRVLGNALTRIAASEALAVVASQTLKHTFQQFQRTKALLRAVICFQTVDALFEKLLGLNQFVGRQLDPAFHRHLRFFS